MQQIKSFRRVRSATVILLGLGAVVIAGLLGLSFVHERETGRDYLNISSSIATTVIDQQLRETAAALSTLERLNSESRKGVLPFAELQSQIASTKSLVTGIDNLLLLDARGSVTASTIDSVVGGNFAFRDYFQEALNVPQGQLVISPPFQASVDNSWKFTLSRALYAETGALQGVAVASFDTSLLTRLIQLHLGDNSHKGVSITLAHANGSPILSVPAQREYARESLAWTGSPLEFHLATGESHSRTEGLATPDSQDALLDLQTIAPAALNLQSPLIVISSYTKQAVYRDWRVITFLVGTAYLLLSGGIAFLLRNEHSHLLKEYRIHQKLEAQSQRLSSIIDGTNVGTWEWNVQTGEVVFNERWADIIGYRLDELAPLSIDTWLSHAHPDDLEHSAEMLKRHFNGEQPYYVCEARMRHRDGHWIWVLDRGKVATWTADGQPLWMYGTHQEITERKLAEEVASKLAYFDSLTNLPNRRLLQERLDNALIQARRNSRTLALMFLDLDNFKPVNDTYGHHCGDQLLIEVAERLQRCVRASDTVARAGGDEFVILLPEIADASDATTVAEKILAALREPIALNETTQVETPPSIGITICTNGSNDGAMLMEQADQAMYAAKHAGRNRYHLFQPVAPASSLHERTQASSRRA